MMAKKFKIEPTHLTKQKLIIVLAMIVYLKNIYSILVSPTSIVNGSLYTLDVGSFQSFLFLFLLPILIFHFYKGRKLAYILLLYYFVHFPSFYLLNLVRYFHHAGLTENIAFLIFFLIVNIFILTLLLDKTISEKFKIDKISFQLCLFTAVIVAFLVFAPYLTVLTILAVFIIPFRINKWDKQIIRNTAPKNASLTGRELIQKKFKMTMLSFLILIPYYFFVSVPLLGDSVYSTDAWGLLYPWQSPFYGFSQEIFYSLPGIISFIWFQFSSQTHPELKTITKNYFWTVVLFYCIIFSIRVINEFT